MGSSSNEFNSHTTNPPSTSSLGTSSSASPPSGQLNANFDSNYDPVQYYFRNEKRLAARGIQYECLQAKSWQEATNLNRILDLLLDPRNDISDNETINWLNALIASGYNQEEFTSLVKSYDNAISCGLVWTANFVAYRCRTCGISPCMSLCTECFQKGNHIGHDYNMFRSQAGGACDCGDPSVMKESGFCSSHQPGICDRKPKVPTEYVAVGRIILPRLLHRLVVQLRKNTSNTIKEAEGFILQVLTSMTEMGAAMRSVMTSALVDKDIYSSLTNSK